jgi:ATP-dependent Lon protease
MEKTQREYYLNEQMKAIQKELGDGEDGRDELPSSKTDREDQADQGSAREGQAELKKLKR